jgi:arylsulfatase A-like enzyme
MKPNILLILIDSFNVRKIISDEKTSKTPNLDWLIKNGIMFTQAISCADATLLSTTGLLTSKIPFKTGIRSPSINKLNKNNLTNFEVLKENGYNLYGFRPTLQENDDLFPQFTNKENHYDVFENLSDGLGNKIINCINNMSNPWMLFLHPHDLHQPIIVSDNFNENEFGTNNYEKQVSAVDYWLGKIFEKIDFSKTLVILTADHGSFVKSPIENNKLRIEADGKKQLFISKTSNKIPKFLDPLKHKLFFYLEKKKKEKREKFVNDLDISQNEKRNLLAGRFTKEHTLYDDQVRIPLVFCGYGIQKGIKISQQVQNIDIFPTIFDIISIIKENDSDGISFKTLLEGKDFEEKPAFLESNPLILTKSEDVIGIRTSKYKYFRDKKNYKKRIHLYDLKNDPFENSNIASKSPEIIKQFEEKIMKITNKYFEKNE